MIISGLLQVTIQSMVAPGMTISTATRGTISSSGAILIGLAGGLTFADLSITGSNGNTSIYSNNELLAKLVNVDVSSSDFNDFTVLI